MKEDKKKKCCAYGLMVVAAALNGVVGLVTVILCRHWGGGWLTVGCWVGGDLCWHWLG